MNSIDLTPFYRSSVGFDRLGRLLDSALRSDQNAGGYPPYNIEVMGENHYRITLAVAGFDEKDLSIEAEGGLLKVRGEKTQEEKDEKREFVHQGIAFRSFERKFSLADHVEVQGARLHNGLLEINLVQIIPEAMKPKRISIDTASPTDQAGDQARLESQNSTASSENQAA